MEESASGSRLWKVSEIASATTLRLIELSIGEVQKSRFIQNEVNVSLFSAWLIRMDLYSRLLLIQA